MLILLLVEDSPTDTMVIHREFEKALGASNVEFTDCTGLQDALAVLGSGKKFDLILLDLALRDSTREQTLSCFGKVFHAAHGTPIIIISDGVLSPEVRGTFAFIAKGPSFFQRLTVVTGAGSAIESKLHKLREIDSKINGLTAS